jgi:hypothetical protein
LDKRRGGLKGRVRILTPNKAQMNGFQWKDECSSLGAFPSGLDKSVFFGALMAAP